MEGFLSHLEELPDPSEVTPSKDLIVSHLSQCHGCGKDFEEGSLKRCTVCKRAYYCQKSCQVKDYKKPRMHKKCCHPDLLSLAMNNIRRLPVDEKMHYNVTGQQHRIPNAHFCQTVAKMSCPNVSDFLECVRREYPLVRDKLCWNKSPTEASRYPGNCQKDMMEQNLYGLDVGVEALCAAINMWPGVYTINSCSGLHVGAWVPTGTDSYHCADFVQFVSDDCVALNTIQAIIERGGFGIQFVVTKISGEADPIGNEDGFVVIDCELGDDLPGRCRTYGRAVSWTPKPFDKLDSVLWMMTNNDPPLKRMQNNLVGFLGVAFELVRANPSLDLTEQEIQKLNEMERPIQLFRKGQIEVVSKLVKDSFNGQDESTEALRKALSDMHLRVTETSVFDMEEKCNRSG